MLLSKEQIDLLFHQPRNGRRDERYRWPNNIVPYKLSLDHSRKQRKHIESALKRIESVSCIKFVRHTNEADYIEVQVNFGYSVNICHSFWSDSFDFKAKRGGCFSSVGRQGGKQIINLQRSELDKNCFRIGTIMHEFLHGEFILLKKPFFNNWINNFRTALGFYHMQSSSDRDDFIIIKWANVKNGKQNRNFLKYASNMVTSFNVPYDYESVMHYGAYAFSWNSRPTIIPIVSKCQH